MRDVYLKSDVHIQTGAEIKALSVDVLITMI